MNAYLESAEFRDLFGEFNQQGIKYTTDRVAMAMYAQV